MHLQTPSETHLLSGDNGSKSLTTLPSGRQLQTRTLGVANHFRDFCLLDSYWQQPRLGVQKAESCAAGLPARKSTHPDQPSGRGPESGNQENQLPTAHGDPIPKAAIVTVPLCTRADTIRNQECGGDHPNSAHIQTAYNTSLA